MDEINWIPDAKEDNLNWSTYPPEKGKMVSDSTPDGKVC